MQFLHMLRRLESREAYRLTRSFLMIVYEVNDALRCVRPASTIRLSQAAHQLLHFVIHADARFKRGRGQRCLARALAAARAAQLILKRLSTEHEHRAIVSAATEVLERTIKALEQEMIR
jgi:hypothetical protein